MYFRSFHDGLGKLEILAAYWGLAAYMAVAGGSTSSVLTILAVSVGVWFFSQHPRAEAVLVGVLVYFAATSLSLPWRIGAALGTAAVLLLLQLARPLFWVYAVAASAFETVLASTVIVDRAGLTDGLFWYAAMGTAVFVLSMTYHEAVWAYLFPAGGGIAKRRVLLPAAGQSDGSYFKDEFWED